MISSTNNLQIKNIQQLQTKAKARRDQDCFIVEGIKMFGEVPKDSLRAVYVSESFAGDNDKISLLSGITYEVVSDSVFAKVSDTITPQGILAVVKQQHYSLDDILIRAENGNSCILVLESINDPGNLGTIIRTGEGAGIAGVIMNKTTVDVYNPKVIRSTMGSIYRVPFLYQDDLGSVMVQLREHKIKTYAAHLNGKGFYYEENYRKSSAFLIGNEANGLSDSLTSQADTLIRIPMAGKVESLNAAIAAAILMYEVQKQKNS